MLQVDKLRSGDRRCLDCNLTSAELGAHRKSDWTPRLLPLVEVFHVSNVGMRVKVLWMPLGRVLGSCMGKAKGMLYDVGQLP